MTSTPILSTLAKSAKRLPTERFSTTGTLALSTLLLATLLIATPLTAQSTGPSALIEQAIIDLGKVPLSTEVKGTFVIENTGDAPLQLHSSKSSCSCAIYEYPEVIAPGEKGEIKVNVDTTLISGPTSIAVKIETNDPSNPLLNLTTKVNSEELLGGYPGTFRYLVYHDFEGDSSIKQTIFAGDGQSFNILDIKPTYPHMTVSEPRPATADERLPKFSGTQWVITAKLNNDAPVGTVTGPVMIHTDHPDQKVLPLLVSGFVRPQIAFTPQNFNFRQFRVPEGGTYLDVNVQHFLEQPIEIEEATIDIEGFDVQVRVIKPGREWNIRAIATPDLAVGPFKGKITLQTESEKLKAKTIPIQGERLAPVEEGAR